MSFQRIALLSLAVVLTALPARLSAQTSTLVCRQVQTSGCLTAGRRFPCSFVLRFDARLEQFTHLEATRAGAMLRDTVPWPPAGTRLPVYAGDMIAVSVANLPWGERIVATGTSTVALPFPRPGLDPEDLPALQLGAYVSQFLRELQGTLAGVSPPMDRAGIAAIESSEFRARSDDFKFLWNRAMRPLELSTPELEERTDAIAARVDNTLTLWAKMLQTASTSILPQVQRMADAASGQAATITHACESDREGCLDALLAASSLAERQRSFQGALAALLDAVHMDAAFAAADSVERLLDSFPVRGILGADLADAAMLSDSTEAFRLLRSGMKVDSNVRENVAWAAKDQGALHDYVALRQKLEGIRVATDEALEAIQAFRAEYESARLRLAVATAELAMSFDAGALARGPDEVLAVLRPTRDENVLVTLTRFPRFAPVSGKVTLPSAITNAAGPPNGRNTPADGAAPAASAASGTRTYSTTLTARKRHGFQVIAGFSLTGVRSVEYGTRDEQTTAGDSLLRTIAVAEEESHRIVPSIQLVWHDRGKDLDPDAYGNRWYVPGLALGTTLDHPLKDFLAGLAFEPMRGIHVAAGRVILRVQRLQEGLEVGSVIPRDARPPVTNHFAGSWYLGGMLDLTVFADFFGNLLKPRG